MIRSMTGFGLSQIEITSSTTIICAIKTLNHKYLDIAISLPKELKPYEPEIMKRVKKSFKRGRIEVTFYNELNHPESETFEIDYQKAEKYFNLLQSLKKRLDIRGDIDISLLSNFKDIFVKKDDSNIPGNDTLGFIGKVLDDSICKASAMRIDEGSAIYNDFKKRIEFIKENLSKITEKSKKNIQLWREKIKKRTDSIKKEIKIDENRLEQEILLYALKSDITEECIRLKNHISQLEKFLDSDNGIGKKLNFLLQEMTREITTIFAKTLSSDIKNLGIEIRDEIEHLREQSYNIE